MAEALPSPFLQAADRVLSILEKNKDHNPFAQRRADTIDKLERLLAIPRKSKPTFHRRAAQQYVAGCLEFWEKVESGKELTEALRALSPFLIPEGKGAFRDLSALRKRMAESLGNLRLPLEEKLDPKDVPILGLLKLLESQKRPAETYRSSGSRRRNGEIR